jgi:hypothetical protein
MDAAQPPVFRLATEAARMPQLSSHRLVNPAALQSTAAGLGFYKIRSGKIAI